MQDMKVHDLTGIAESGVPLYPLSVGRQNNEKGWSDGVYGPQVRHCGLNFGLRGSGEMKVLDRTYPLGPGDSVWYLPGEDNSAFAINGSWEYDWVVFGGPLAGAILLSYRYPRRLTGAKVQTVEPIFQELFRKIDSPSTENRRELAALLLKLFAAVGGPADNQRPTLPKLFLEIIEREYADPNLNINIVCERLRVSPATLHRVISGELHHPPGQYLRNYRIMRAHFMLRNTTLPVGEIAAACGFADENYFCRQIRRNSGCSPLEFRERELAEPGSLSGT